MTGAVFAAGTRACFRFFATAALLQSRTDGFVRKSARSEEIASDDLVPCRDRPIPTGRHAVTDWFCGTPS
jgi:hypothetical protein